MRSDAAIPAIMRAAGDVVVRTYRVPRSCARPEMWWCARIGISPMRCPATRRRTGFTAAGRSSNAAGSRSWASHARPTNLRGVPRYFVVPARVGPRGTPGGGIELLASTCSGSPHYVSSSWRAPGMARSVLSRETARPSSESFAGRAGRPMINKPAAARVEQYPTSIATCPPSTPSPAHWPGESLDLDRICDNTFRRSLFMNQRSIHRGGRFSSTLGAYLLALTTVAALHAQEAPKGSEDTPVRKELEEFPRSRQRQHRLSGCASTSKGSRRSADRAWPTRR